VRKADNLPPACADVKNSGSLKLLELCGPVQASNGTDLAFILQGTLNRKMFQLKFVIKKKRILHWMKLSDQLQRFGLWLQNVKFTRKLRNSFYLLFS
jgi:hypothetical protein